MNAKAVVEMVILTGMAVVGQKGAAMTNDAVGMTTARVYTDAAGTVLPYREYMWTEAPGKKVPLVLYLHGSGSCGTNNLAQIGHSVQELIRYAGAHGGAMVLAPQAQGQWVNKMPGLRYGTFTKPTKWMFAVLALLKEKLGDARVDPSRVYAMGSSLGGFGTWDILAREPQLVAAAVPISGGGDPACAERFKDVPLSAFHGARDRNVPVGRSREMLAALWKLGAAHAHYTEYPTMAHAVWTRTDGNRELMDWLFAQRRGVSTEGVPVPSKTGGKK